MQLTPFSNFFFKTKMHISVGVSSLIREADILYHIINQLSLPPFITSSLICNICCVLSSIRYFTSLLTGGIIRSQKHCCNLYLKSHILSSKNNCNQMHILQLWFRIKESSLVHLHNYSTQKWQVIIINISRIWKNRLE